MIMDQFTSKPKELAFLRAGLGLVFTMLWVTAIAGAGPALTDYTISKRQDYAQTGTNPPVLIPNAPFSGQLELVQTTAGVVTGAAATFPGGHILAFDSQGMTSFEIQTNFPDEATLDAFFPSGSYSLEFTDEGAAKTLILELPSDSFPPAPRIANIVASEAINPGSDFMVQWAPFIGAAGDDFILLEIDDTSGNEVFATPEILSPGYLPGSARFAMVPAGSLKAGDTYKAKLAFYHVTSLDTNSYPGAFGGVAFISRTSFSVAASTNTSKTNTDLSEYFVSKNQVFSQTGQNFIPKDPVAPFQAWSGFFQTGAGAVSNAYVYAPGGGVATPKPDATFPTQWVHKDGFRTEQALNTGYPAGSYAFLFGTLDNGQEAGAIQFPEGLNYPPAPEIVNYTAAQTINSKADFELHWAADSGGGAGDSVWLFITSANGSVVFTTPYPPGVPGSLRATNSLAVIPAGTLQPGRSYEGRLEFTRAVATNSASIPGAPGLAIFASVNNFKLSTAPLATAPIITKQPVSQTNIPGSTLSFTVAASGTAPLTYHWLFNGTNIPGATRSQLILAKVQASQAGIYTVVVSNLAGSVASKPAFLTITSAPVITEQPQSETVTAGRSARFSVGATGTSPLFFQWQFNGTNITGATLSSLLLTNVQPAQAGVYAVNISNAFGVVVSKPATLGVTLAPGSIAGGTLAMVIGGGSAPFASNGSYLLSADSAGSAYNLTPLSTNISFSQGSYTYLTTGSNTARMALKDSLAGAAAVTLEFTNANTGFYTMSRTNSPGIQTGTFTLITAPYAPLVITGKTITFVIANATGSFAAAGAYEFEAAAKGGDYLVVPLAGGTQASQGTYGYHAAGLQVGVVNFTDSISKSGLATLTFTAPRTGLYILTSPGTSGRQTGSFTTN